MERILQRTVKCEREKNVSKEIELDSEDRVSALKMEEVAYVIKCIKNGKSLG